MLKKVAAAVLHLVMFALVCAAGAYWAIRIMTPPPDSSPPSPRPSAMPREADPTLAARMFGLVQTAPVQLALNVQAVGAFAAGRDSAAVLVVDGKPPRVFLLDQEVARGAKLVEVRRDAVTIEQDGARRSIALPAAEVASVGGPPPAPGFTREGMVLTAPTVAGTAQPTVAGRALPPRGLAAPQTPQPPSAVPSQMPQPPSVVQPLQPLQPMPAPPQIQQPPGPQGEAEESSAPRPIRRSGQGSRPLSQ